MGQKTAEVSLSFEKAVNELESIVSQLENGDVALEQSIALYKRGQELKTHCQNLLDKARAEVQHLNIDGENNPTDSSQTDLDDWCI